jgi:hypothetical protein
MKTPSDIEISKLLRHVRAVVTQQQYESIQKTLIGGRNEEVDRAVEGLSEEDEFVLLCLLMNTSTQLAPLDQTASIAAGAGAPDLLVRFQPGFYMKGLPAARHQGYKCLVEIKSTRMNKFSMGGAALRKLRAFADSFGLPLLFAVRFVQYRSTAIWVIAEDGNRENPSVKISLSDWIDGLRPVLWNEYAYMIMPGTKVQVTYSGSIKGENVRHPEYGEQVRFRVVTGQRSIDFNAHDSVLASAFLDAFYLSKTDVELDGSLVHVTYSPESQALSIADIVYRMNRLPADEQGQLTYHAGTVIRQLAEGRSDSLITRTLVENLGKAMCDSGVLSVLGYGGLEETFRKWIATGGKE